jgi:biopolymer transport protein ExbD
MAIQLTSEQSDDEVLSQINTTPLVDVMLVLLIIFLITIPVVNSSVPVTLPKERVEERQTKPENIVITVDRHDRMYWYDTPMDSMESLIRKLKVIATQQPQPEVQIRGDMSARYGGVGRVLYACQRAGVSKVSFVTEPAARGL